MSGRRFGSTRRSNSTQSVRAHGRRLGAAVLAVLVTLLAFPGDAWAHDVGGQAAGFLSGLYHPISGLDHVLAMVAVGLWGAQLGQPAVWVLPVTFPMVMAFGGMLGLIGVPIPGIEIGIAVSALLLGLMVCTEARPRLEWAAVLVGFFAVFHGHAHGVELAVGQSAIYYSLGFTMATGSLHAVGIGIGVVHRWPQGRIALRFMGAGVAAAGVLFLWQAVT